MFIFKSKTLSSVLALTVCAGGAAAQDSGADSETRVLGKVEVTAQKQVQDLQDVPIAVNVLSEEQIQLTGIDDALELANFVPSLNITAVRNPFQSRVAIRGLGTSQNDPSLEPSVGMFVDGVFLGRSGLGMSDLTDIERIEVLQGPQGTLYGKNTNAGAISIITKQPNFEEFEGYIDASVGDFNMRRVTVSATGPLSDTVAFRVSGNIHKRNGYYENAGSGNDTNGADDWNLQGKLLWEPSENLSVLLSGSHVERDTNGSGFDSTFSPLVQAELNAQGLTVPTNDPFDFEIANNTQGVFEMESDSLALTVELDGDWGTFTSITAWNDYEFFTRADNDGSELDILRTLGEPFSGDSISQEIRLASSVGENVQYQVGLFYLEQTDQRGEIGEIGFVIGDDFATLAGPLFLGANAVLDPPGPAGPFRLMDFAAQPGDSIGGRNVWDTETLALFGQTTWDVTDDLHLTAGLRWTDESKDADLLTVTSSTATGVPAPLQGALPPSLINFLSTPFIDRLTTAIDAELSRSNTSTDWLLKAAYDLGDDTLIYASASTGTKSGNFNGVSGPENTREFEDETTTSYELGVKSDLFGSRVRLNAAAFMTQVEDWQFQAPLPTGGSTISNEGEVELAGIDVSLQALLFDNLTVDAGLLHMNKYEVTAGPNTGKELGFVADWSGNVGATLVFPVASGNIYVRGDYIFMNDHWVTNRDDRVASTDRYDRSLVNARLGWRNDHWNFSIWGQNLTEDDYPTTTNAVQSYSGNQAFVLSPPRTYGVSVRRDF